MHHNTQRLLILALLLIWPLLLGLSIQPDQAIHSEFENHGNPSQVRHKIDRSMAHQQMSSQPDPNIGKPLATTDLKQTTAIYRSVLEDLGFELVYAGSYMKFVGQTHRYPVTLEIGVRTRNRYATPEISYRQYTGLILTIQLKTDIATYLLFSKADSQQQWLIQLLQRLNGNHDVASLSQQYQGYQIWAREPAWAQQVLTDSKIQTAVRQLLYDTQGMSNGNLLNWAPHTFSFTPLQVPLKPTAKQVQSWLEPMALLVQQTEQIPPKHVAQLNWLGQQAEQGRLWLLVLIPLVGIPILITIVTLIIGIAIALVLR